MKFALVNDARSLAQPKLRGSCPRCDGEMVSKCGRTVSWHWAHKGNSPCDPWWENETDWHRSWKDRFPAEWQERIAHDDVTGEKHIADVKTSHGLILEFQHSAIDTAEVEARESFYKNMVWIIDGDRGSLDPNYFTMGLSGPIQDDPLSYKIEWWGRSRLFHRWSRANANVYIDFGGDLLWRLILFDCGMSRGAVGPIHKHDFVEDCLSGRPISVLAKLQEEIE